MIVALPSKTKVVRRNNNPPKIDLILSNRIASKPKLQLIKESAVAKTALKKSAPIQNVLK